MDSTGFAFVGEGSWQIWRFHKKPKRRNHRKASLLVETRESTEKFIYDWELDTSNHNDIDPGRNLIQDLPRNTCEASFDAAYDARDIYATIEKQGARAFIQPRRNARTTTLDARGRAIRRKQRNGAAWERRYHRRSITESVNSSLKRRFGDRLRSKGLHNQRREFGLRVLVYNLNMHHRRSIRAQLTGRAP